MVEVVAALIWDGNRFLICQRPANKARALLWEFVGGKVEAGETKKQALIRECREELDITIDVGDEFMSVTHEYPDITVHLTLFNATIREGTPALIEHHDLRWITPVDIPAYEFCPADEEILARLIARHAQGPALRMAEEADMAAVFALRFEVFVGEQGVPPEIELDAEDAQAMHLIAEVDGVVVGCARVILHDGCAHIGRLAVTKGWRGRGIGAAICRFAVERCRISGCVRVGLHAQRHAVGFYEKLGFRPRGEIFLEAGIEHVEMEMDMLA